MRLHGNAIVVYLSRLTDKEQILLMQRFSQFLRYDTSTKRKFIGLVKKAVV
jgi:hypothetical protein